MRPAAGLYALSACGAASRAARWRAEPASRQVGAQRRGQQALPRRRHQIRPSAPRRAQAERRRRARSEVLTRQSYRTLLAKLAIAGHRGHRILRRAVPRTLPSGHALPRTSSQATPWRSRRPHVGCDPGEDEVAVARRRASDEAGPSSLSLPEVDVLTPLPYLSLLTVRERALPRVHTCVTL